MSYNAPSQCPVCASTLKVSGMQCQTCGTELHGTFSLCRFCLVNEKERQFIETFLRCRGSIKDVEKALGVSYPTVRNMLDQALRSLGLFDEPTGGSRREILEQLEAGKLSTEEAMQRLNTLKEGPA